MVTRRRGDGSNQLRPAVGAERGARGQGEADDEERTPDQGGYARPRLPRGPPHQARRTHPSLVGCRHSDGGVLPRGRSRVRFHHVSRPRRRPRFPQPGWSRVSGEGRDRGRGGRRRTPQRRAPARPLPRQGHPRAGQAGAGPGKARAPDTEADSRTPLFFAAVLALDAEHRLTDVSSASTVRAVWLADLDPAARREGLVPEPGPGCYWKWKEGGWNRQGIEGYEFHCTARPL